MNEYTLNEDNKDFTAVDNDFIVNMLNEQNMGDIGGQESAGNFLDFENNYQKGHNSSSTNLVALQQQHQQQQQQFQQHQQFLQQQQQQNNQNFGSLNKLNLDMDSATTLQPGYPAVNYTQKQQQQQQQLFLQQQQQQQQQEFNNGNANSAAQNGNFQQRKRNVSFDKKENPKSLLKTDLLTKQQEQILETNKNLFNYKNNLKNTYINKINSLMTENPAQEKQKNPKNNQQNIGFKVEEDYVNPYQNQQQMIQNMARQGGLVRQGQSSDEEEQYMQDENGDLQGQNSNIKAEDVEKLNQKLARNRESARNSRKRKKVYIELLESKVNNLTEELEKTRKMLDQSKEYMNKINSHNQILTGFVFGRQQLFDKLEKALKTSADENELNLLLDSLRFRLGATGKERIIALNHFFKQMLDICMPTHFRYLLWTASEGHDIFCDNLEGKLEHLEGKSQQIPEKQSWRHELISYLNLNDKQKGQLKKFQKKFMSEKVKMEQLIEQLQEIKENIKQKTLGIENQVDDIRTIMTPAQSAKFLLFLEKNKYRREISNQNLWEVFRKNSDFEEEDEEDLLQQTAQQNQQQLQIQSQMQEELSNSENELIRKKVCNTQNKSG